MPATLYRIAEQIKALLNGGSVAAASMPDDGDLKIAICQAGNAVLKADYVTASTKMGDVIPNGAVAALYEEIAVTSLGGGGSKAHLPVKPLSLRRGVGVWSIYPKYTANGRYVPKDEFIPIQMGQQSLLDSQPMINDLLGLTGYEVVNMDVYFNKDLKLLYPQIVLAMRLLVLDMEQYGDYDILPLSPEMELTVIGQVLQLYGVQPPENKKVDSTSKQKMGGNA